MRDQDFFWEGVDRSELLAQCCTDCGHLRHPPGPMCPNCLSLAWEPKKLSGKGSVNTFMVSKHPTRADTYPRIVVLIDLTEGIRMVSNLEDIEIGAVATGMQVKVVFRDVNGTRLPVFIPEGVAA